jgi:hypothetical protein
MILLYGRGSLQTLQTPLDEKKKATLPLIIIDGGKG